MSRSRRLEAEMRAALLRTKPHTLTLLLVGSHIKKKEIGQCLLALFHDDSAFACPLKPSRARKGQFCLEVFYSKTTSSRANSCRTLTKVKFISQWDSTVSNGVLEVEAYDSGHWRSGEFCLGPGFRYSSSRCLLQVIPYFLHVGALS